MYFDNQERSKLAKTKQKKNEYRVFIKTKTKTHVKLPRKNGYNEIIIRELTEHILYSIFFWFV